MGEEGRMQPDETFLKTYSCKFCNSKKIALNEKTFSNGTIHLEMKCEDCNKHNGYAPQNIEPNKFTMPFGKFKGKTFVEIDMEDPDYVRWIAENIGGSCSKRAESYLEQKHRGEIK